MFKLLLYLIEGIGGLVLSVLLIALSLSLFEHIPYMAALTSPLMRWVIGILIVLAVGRVIVGAIKGS